MLRLPPMRVINPHSVQHETIVREATHEADRLIAETDKILDRVPADAKVVPTAPTEEVNISDSEDKLSRLIDDDFPFDDSQLAAVFGLVQQQYGCLIGAAGTGKTTVTKKFVDMLRGGLEEVDLSKYWQRGAIEEHDEYETPEKLIPSIVMVSFTGRASQMTKKNFPRDWHSNIMTIHRALGFYPEFFLDVDPENPGQLKNKRRFVPAYTAENKMPWKIVIVDEAGMLGLDLWHQLLDACESDTRIYIIGDINQLPPTHGKSILGFALAKWPTWELTHIHRQKGANNSIVDNAHRILAGRRPICDSQQVLSVAGRSEQILEAVKFMVNNKDWRFLVVEIPDEHRMASLRIRQVMKLIQNYIYEPNRDVLITPINGYEQTNPGYSLGQSPLNQELVIALNADSPRYFIDAGRERQNFAVGDKVMATVNDYEAGITNGMTGIILSIVANGGYDGDTQRFGLITVVNDYYAGIAQQLEEDEDDEEFSMTAMLDAVDSEEIGKQKDKRDAGPASHIVTVRFGEGEHGFEIAFDSKSRVASIVLAYAATCHKMQGGEAPLVMGIVHSANKRPLCREWFYTMVTRASERCVVFCNKQGLGFALGKQNIKGVTLKQKVATFVALTETGLVGASMKVKLPKSRPLVEVDELVTTQANVEVDNNLPAALSVPQATPFKPTIQMRDRVVRVEVIHKVEVHYDSEKELPREAIDGGTIQGTSTRTAPPTPTHPAGLGLRLARPALPAPTPMARPAPQCVSQPGASNMLCAITAWHPALLEYHIPTPPVKPANQMLRLIQAQKRK